MTLKELWDVIVPSILIISYLSSALCLCSLIFVYATIFPFYSRVFNVNREKEKETAIYPIINHFYKGTCVSYVVYLCLLLFDWFFPVGLVTKEVFHKVDNAYLFVKQFYIMVLNAHHIIIFLLALQRFTLFFIFRLEKYANVSEKTMNRVLFLIYSVIIIKYTIWFVVDYMDNSYIAYYLIFGIGEFFILTILLLISALLYIPIMICIRKNAHLTSLRKHKPHRYIFYQTFALVLLKTATIQSIFVHIQINENPIFDRGTYFHIAMWNYLSIPVIIQASYILCNKRNFETLGYNNSVKSMIVSTFYYYFKRSKVQPASHVEYHSNVASTALS
ncbi:hypothetical protein CRE_15670 [Caenorhabditis remanei]|uniref:Uncharacterized protein n=1 Tax=Caenorhabditis remanei TaxID=31234 RepID=E3N890_CAERE|nr:hypothetical protein CRE_15670 [Caenorhabditis remanei]